MADEKYIPNGRSSGAELDRLEEEEYARRKVAERIWDHGDGFAPGELFIPRTSGGEQVEGSVT